MKRRSFIKSLLSALGALFAPAFAPKEADATLYMMPFVPSCGTDDWAARSAGALLADRLDTAGSISSYAFAGGSDPRLWVLDPTIKSGCSLGSAKFVVANTDVAASGEALIPFGTNFGSGSTFWISYRIRQLATFAFQPWPAPSETGAKVSVLSHTSGSNQPWEAVVQANYNEGLIGGYHQDGVVTAIPWDVSATTAYGSDFIWQPAVDRGVNPLLGTNPDTAAAWSAGEQDRARYGGLYTSKSLASSKLGLGDWLSGGERHWPGEWVTITQRIVIGTFGSFDSRWTIWSARDGQPYTLLADNQNIRFGGSGPFNAVWLLPYVSQRVAGGKQISSRTNNIGGVSLYTCGLSTPIGTGVLEYDASVQRFRWHGVSEAFGAQAGFSAANGKMWRNVISGGDPNSYVVLHVDTPSSLPPSGVVTDNVVIADGRPDTQVNYADFIVSTSAINAPGGFSPLLPTLPYSIPAQGHFKNISLNNLVDVQACQSGPAGANTPPCPYVQQGVAGVMNIWNGGAYGADYSAYGALYVYGGGHNGYAGNEVYAFNLTNALWERCRNPSLYTEYEADTNPASPTYGEYPDGQPGVEHTYAGPQAIPASWYGGVRGKFLMNSFIPSRWYTMNMDDAFPRSWSRFAATAASYCHSARDDNRRGIWRINGAGISYLAFIDGVTGAVTNYMGTAIATEAYPVLGYSPSLDILIAGTGTYDRIGTGSGGDILTFYILPCSSPNSDWKPQGGPFGITWSGTAPGGITYSSPNGAGGITYLSRAGLEWSTILNCFVSMYPGDNGATVYFLHPPAGATTFAQLLAGTWTWTSETLVGDASAVPSHDAANNGHYSRFREVPLLKSFVFADAVDQPVQLWRPTGMV